MINSPKLSTGHTCMAYPKDTYYIIFQLMLHTLLLILKKKGTSWYQKDLKLYAIAHKINNFKAEVAQYYLIWSIFFLEEYSKALNTSKETKLNVKEY